MGENVVKHASELLKEIRTEQVRMNKIIKGQLKNQK